MIIFNDVSISPLGAIPTNSLFVLSIGVNWIATTWEQLCDELLSWQHLVDTYSTWKKVMDR